MRHGLLKFGDYENEDWDRINEIFQLIDIDYYEPEVWWK